MKTLTDHLAQYASYHRDIRNIQTHFVGIPMIVLAITSLLSRPSFDLAGLAVTPAIIVAIGICIFYFRLNIGFGILMTGILSLAVLFGQWSASQTTSTWLRISIISFVVGWVIQFIGHYFEGKKPAFVDDLVGLFIGPAFIVAEVLFKFGFMPDIKDEVKRRAGHVRSESMH